MPLTNELTKEQKAEAEQSRRAVEEARDFQRHCLIAQDEANTALGIVRQNLTQGDPIEPGALATAEANYRQAEVALSGAAQRVRLAKRAEVTDDLSLAEALAETVQASFPGVPVIVTNERPSRLRTALPAIYLVQRRPYREDHRTGEMSGRVVVWYLRSALHSSLSRELWRERVVIGQRVDAGPDYDGQPDTQEMGTGYADRIPLRVRGLMAELPVISGEPAMTDLWGLAVGATASATDSFHGRDSFGQVTAPGAINVDRSSLQVVEDDTDSDGIRTCVVAATLHAKVGSQHVRRDHAPEIVRAAAEASIGRRWPCIGRLTAVQITPMAPPPVGPMPLAARYTVVSKRGDR